MLLFKLNEMPLKVKENSHVSNLSTGEKKIIIWAYDLNFGVTVQ